MEEGFFVEWGGLGNAVEPEGAVEITLKIDTEFVGSFGTQALEPGTETAFSNIVETQVFAPGMLPQAGGGAPVAGSHVGAGIAFGIVLMTAVGAVFLSVGATFLARRGSG